MEILPYFDLTDISLSVSSDGTVDLTDFDSLSESNNGDVDVHVDDNNHIFSNVLQHVVLWSMCVFSSASLYDIILILVCLAPCYSFYKPIIKYGITPKICIFPIILIY